MWGLWAQRAPCRKWGAPHPPAGGFTTSLNRVISAGRFTGREMTLERFSLSMTPSPLVGFLPDLTLPVSVTGSGLAEVGSLLTNTCLRKNGFPRRLLVNREAILQQTSQRSPASD